MTKDTTKPGYDIQGKYELELKFVDERLFLNFWDNIRGEDVCCQIKGGKLFKINWDDDIKTEQEIDFLQFIELVKTSITNRDKPFIP